MLMTLLALTVFLALWLGSGALVLADGWRRRLHPVVMLLLLPVAMTGLLGAIPYFLLLRFFLPSVPLNPALPPRSLRSSETRVDRFLQ